MTNEYNPDGKKIRFIDSHYKDLFHIPDGNCVQIHYPDETVVKPCTFIDEYHTQIGYNVFHICQFAEIMERNGASYMPEPEIMGDEAAWKVGRDRILAVQTCEDGYDYTLLDENYNEIDGGQVDNPELSMIEVRQDILESFGLERRELRAMFYEDVMEQAFEVGRQAVVVNDPIAELAFKLDRFAENFDPYEYMDQVDDVQAHIQEIKADLTAGNTAPYREFLNTAIAEAREETAVEVAKVLKKAHRSFRINAPLHRNSFTVYFRMSAPFDRNLQRCPEKVVKSAKNSCKRDEFPRLGAIRCFRNRPIWKCCS